jgi:hypothetical protein
VGCNNDHRAIRGAAMATLDYGTRINDLPHIREYRVRSNVFAGSGLDRPQLLGTSTGRAESLDLGMVRFKLYSIEVDEVTNVIAFVSDRAHCNSTLAITNTAARISIRWARGTCSCQSSA